MEIKDTYPDFLSYWKEAQELPVEGKLEKWRSEYMKKYPSLLSKQLEDYENEDIDWQQVAKERVFPYLEERLPEMTQARSNLRDIIHSIYKHTCDFFDFNLEVTAVIYVGIGCGAGWATEFKGKSALLFGLENIAECGWSDSRSLEGLVAHELGHLFHERIRESMNLAFDDGPLWRLYKEGIAKWSEFELLNRESWYEARGLNEPDWLDWCKENRAWLAEKFLGAVKKGKSTDQFFGSWYEVEGWKQTGYFLGYEAVTHLISSRNLAKLDPFKISNPPKQMRQVLEKLMRI
jgi:hypothetical protein